MGKCRNCNLEILDAAERCPLCRTVLEQTDELENMYPDIRLRTRRLLFVSRLYLFCAILAEGVLVAVNLLTEHRILWCIVTGLALLLGFVIFRFGIVSRAGYRSKIIILALAVVLFAIGVDLVIGYRGWSLDYVIPGGILIVDVFIIVYMICNHRNWQSYIMWQLLMILLSLIPVGLFLADLEQNPCLSFLPLVASSLLFLGTLLIGGQPAATELKRRFHFR